MYVTHTVSYHDMTRWQAQGRVLVLIYMSAFIQFNSLDISLISFGSFAVCQGRSGVVETNNKTQNFHVLTILHLLIRLKTYRHIRKKLQSIGLVRLG